MARHRKRRKWPYFAVLILLIAAIGTTIYYFNTNDNSHKVASVDDLSGARIGVQLGTVGDTYASDYEDDDAGTSIIRYNKGADAILALKQNKIDCVIIDEQPAIAFTAKNTDLSILEEEFALEDYALCIAKNNTALLTVIDDAIENLKASGTLENIFNNYIGENKGKTPYVTPEGTEYPNGTLVVATNAEFPPYEYFQDGEPVGIDIDIMRAIGDLIGYDIKVNHMDFDSIIMAVNSGKADVGASGFTVTEDRLKNINFSIPYTTSKQVIIVKNGKKAESQSFVTRFKQSFIEDNRWQYITKGLYHTLIVTVFAGIGGLVIGFILAIIRVAGQKNEDGSILVKILNLIARIYITIFRGTPMLVQLLIIFYVVFASVDINPVLVAILAFSLNSGAYVAEAIRSGIIAIPDGQFEAGRSLGFTFMETMCYIVLPQGVKNSLPAMCNEFIALLKESSIVGYIGIIDLTKGGDIIRSNTYEALIPLICVALIYLVIVLILTSLVGALERRLKRDAK